MRLRRVLTLVVALVLLVLMVLAVVMAAPVSGVVLSPPTATYVHPAALAVALPLALAGAALAVLVMCRSPSSNMVMGFAHLTRQHDWARNKLRELVSIALAGGNGATLYHAKRVDAPALVLPASGSRRGSGFLPAGP